MKNAFSRREFFELSAAASGITGLGSPGAPAPVPQTTAQSSSRDDWFSHVPATRSVVRASHGMVATSQPLASQTGLEILKRGGNAVDAAIAMAAVLNVTEPHMTGIGGDVFAMVYSSKTKTLEGLNASGRAPRALGVDYFRSRQIRDMPQ